MGGWASNSKYPFLGSLRSAAQMVSYEVSIGLVIINVILLVGSHEPHPNRDANQAGGFWTWHALGFNNIILLELAAAVRHVRGSSSSRRWPRPTGRPSTCLRPSPSSSPATMVEYGSTPYLLFMLGEYLNIVLMCAMMTAMLFLGGWHGVIPLGQDFVETFPAWMVNLGHLMWFAGKMVFWSSSCSPW